MSFTIDFEPIGTRLICEDAIVLRDAAAQAGVPLKSICGGKTICGKCLVKVTGTGVSQITDAEKTLLSTGEIEAGYRQACRTVVSGDVTVFVPRTSMVAEQKLQIEGVETRVELDPLIHKLFVEVTPASLADQRGDFDRTADALWKQHEFALVKADLLTLNQLSASLRDGNWSVTVGERDGEMIAVEPGDMTQVAVGLAVDLGTTKIACYLVDLLSGRTLATRGVMNPQIGYGEDLITRIDAARKNLGTRRELSEMVIAAINEAVAELCRQRGISPTDLLEVCIVGNTVMQHLAVRLPVEQLGLTPFVPVTAHPLEIKCAELGLISAPGAYAYFLPPVAGFVGADHVAVLLASEFGQDDRTRLAVDLGTNTEIALQVGGRIRSCSTACGPAFEGAHIRCGMRAAPGAIERVKIDSVDRRVKFSTIGDKPPVGICGSGILDAVAEMLKTGYLNQRGRLSSDLPGIREGQDGYGREFLLARFSPEGGREVVITQKDLAEIQLAKGAIRAGIDILLEDAGLMPREIDEVILAGAFGTFLDPFNAVRLGMFPKIPLTRIHQVGNAAGMGAKRALVSCRERAEAARLARQVEYLELTLHPQFARYFARAMRYE